jgi:thiol:disulfide interchange protein DsbD
MAWAVGGAAAPDTCASAGASEHVRVRLISERESLVPGQTALLGVCFDVEPGWHIYWDGLNDSGMPPMVTLQLPPGFTAGPIRWPVPTKRHVAEGGILDHLYEGRVTLVVPVMVPAGALPGQSATFHASLDWFVCKDVCIRESGRADLTLPVTAAAAEPPRLTPDASLLAGPFPEPTLPRWISTSWMGRTLRIMAEPPAGPPVMRLEFYPLADCAPPADLVRQGEASGTGLSIDFSGSAPPEARARGVLMVFRAPPPADAADVRAPREVQRQAFLVDIAVPPGAGS